MLGLALRSPNELFRRDRVEEAGSLSLYYEGLVRTLALD